MRCPKCRGALEEKSYGRKISIHRCADCGGLWCGADALLEMKREWMSDAILDSGDPKLGAELDEHDDIDCPQCGARMDKTYDERQVHIWYEACPNGHGLFLDAGEFTDLKYDTLLDRVRDWVRGRRPESSD